MFVIEEDQFIQMIGQTCSKVAPHGLANLDSAFIHGWCKWLMLQVARGQTKA
jgi:hypothetical protein